MTQPLTGFRGRDSHRAGAILGLVGIMLPVLMILVAIAVNASYMQLTRTELKIATDTAVLAAGRTYGETQNISTAENAACITAAMNLVGGQPLRLLKNNEEIQFGYSQAAADGSGVYQFTALRTNKANGGSQSVNAVRIHSFGRHTSNTGNNASNEGKLGPISLLLPTFSEITNFVPKCTSAVVQADRDIVLVLDRSGSMGDFDQEWPDDASYASEDALAAATDEGIIYWDANASRYELKNGKGWPDYYRYVWEDFYGLGTYHGTNWQGVLKAVNRFTTVLAHTPPDEHLAVASYANADSASVDCLLTRDYGLINEATLRLLPGGMTGIGAGMLKGHQALLHDSARPTAVKTMVVMTDGWQNDGIDPVVVATELTQHYRLTIHTITFGDAPDVERMKAIAKLGHGNYYHAQSGADLYQAFQQIASQLPVMLIQ